MIQKSTSLKYEPASEPLHISVKYLAAPRQRTSSGATSPTRHRSAVSPYRDPTCPSFGVENNYLTEMCSGSGAGSYLRLIDFVYEGGETGNWAAEGMPRRAMWCGATMKSGDTANDVPAPD